MDNRDDKLTRKNIDEQIERCLSEPQGPQTPTMVSLSHTIRDLQSIYAEERRLEHIWARVNTRVTALNAVRMIQQTEELSTVLLAQSELQGTRRTAKWLRQLFLLIFHIIGSALVAAIILIAYFTWPVWLQALHSWPMQSSTYKATPQSQATTNTLNMQKYVGQDFKLQYPVHWVIASETPTGFSLETVRFRPSMMSSVFVQVDAMPGSQYSAHQLLDMDADAKLGTVQSTRSVTSHGLSWVISIVKLTASVENPAGELEIAYSNQGTPYRIEFGAPSDLFSSDTAIFDAVFASFYPQTEPTVTPTMMPSPTENGIVTRKLPLSLHPLVHGRVP